MTIVYDFCLEKTLIDIKKEQKRNHKIKQQYNDIHKEMVLKQVVAVIETMELKLKCKITHTNGITKLIF